MPSSAFSSSSSSRPTEKENGYVFEDVEDDDDETDFIVDNLRIANEAFRRQSQQSSTAGNSRLSSGGSVSQYSVNNTRRSTNDNHDGDNLEKQYTHAMSRVSRAGDYYFEPVGSSSQQQQRRSVLSSSSSANQRPPTQERTEAKQTSDRNSRGSRESSGSGNSSGNKNKPPRYSHPKPVASQLPSHKLPASSKDPSEEVLALFGAHGVTGHHFLQLALEAGYKQVRCLLLPGMTEQGFAEDFGGTDNLPPNLKLIVGTLDDTEKVQRVVKNASYVVCLLHDAERPMEQQTNDATVASSSSKRRDELPELHKHYDHSQTPPPRDSTGSAKSNDSNGESKYPHLHFMEALVPLLESDKSPCRVLLYQASSASIDDKGVAPIAGQVVKTLNLFNKVKRQQLKEQDRIVKYLAETTRDMRFNFVITRPGDLVWDRPSRKKLAASKSVRFMESLFC